MIALTNVGTAYDAITASRGLGLQRIDFTGVSQVAFDVLVNKVGTGTQNWQLWNVTDGTEIGVIADSGAAGDNKLLAGTFAVALTGEKVCRVRAKSTVAGDDPVFYGCSVLLR